MDNREELLSALVLELRRGTIVLCVLSRLKEPKYGYDLIRQLEEKGINVDTSTLYPLLRRLEKQGVLISEWITDESKPRKYYKRTILGDELYKDLAIQWKEMNNSMNELIQ